MVFHLRNREGDVTKDERLRSRAIWFQRVAPMGVIPIAKEGFILLLVVAPTGAGFLYVGNYGDAV